MFNIPSLQPYAQEQIIANLQHALSQSEAQRKQLAHELGKYREREQWEKRLFSNPHIWVKLNKQGKNDTEKELSMFALFG